MLLLLSAAALESGAGSTVKPTNGECMHPPNEDPMAWDCDCFAEMHDKCKRAGANNPKKLRTCLQAQFCLHGRVCKSWKRAVCKSRKIGNWKKKLKSLPAELAQSHTMPMALV